MIAGRPISSSARSASGRFLVWIERGVSSPILVMASRKRRRSSALSMASAVAPIISTSNLSSVPCRRSDSAQFSAVWPPMVGSSAKPPGNDVAFLLDDLGDDFGRDRLDIGGIRQFRVGHDGGRIGIDEDDAVALFLQRLHRLGAGIVEFAGLADHDGTGADDQDGGDICSFGHQLSDWILGTKKGRACRASPKPRARVTLARGWSLDQIPHPRNPQKRAINRHFRDSAVFDEACRAALVRLRFRFAPATPDTLRLTVCAWLRRRVARQGEGVEARPGFEPG